jgi:two-component system, LuxR family, response regulator FixJ
MNKTAKPTVYLVDDDKSVRDFIKGLLKSAGVPLVSHASAEDLLEALPENAVGCLLTELRLPGIGGFELMHELNSWAVSLPTIILTGHADIPLAVKAMRGGAFEVLEKPARDQPLIKRLKQALAISQKWRAIQTERKSVAARLAKLTRRERQVMAMLVSGMRNRAIAEELGISSKTLDIHRAKVMGKMEARTTADLVRWSYLDNPRLLPATTLTVEVIDS